MRAVFDVHEGPKTTVEAVRIEGASLVPAEDARPRPRQPGGRALLPAQRPKGRRARSRRIYLNRGVRGSDGRRPRRALAGQPGHPRLRDHGGHAGSPSGTSSSPGTGRRGTASSAGRSASRRAIRPTTRQVQETKRRLERLGIFSEVRVDEVQTGPDDEVVVVTVREGEKNYTGLGLGFESQNPVSGSLADLAHRPPAARHGRVHPQQRLRPRAPRWASSARSARSNGGRSLSWNQPYLLGLSMPTTFLAWVEREVRDELHPRPPRRQLQRGQAAEPRPASCSAR